VTVTISVTGDGIVIDPEVATLNRGDEVQWTSDLDFAVAVERNADLFGRRLPPQALRGRARSQGQGPAMASVRARAGANAPVGAYKYSVAVWDGEDVWVVDPEIVIVPPN
jgi:hypothetical protein